MIYTNGAYKQLDKLGQMVVSDLMVNYNLDLELLYVDSKVGLVKPSVEKSKYRMRKNKHLFRKKKRKIMSEFNENVEYFFGKLHSSGNKFVRTPKVTVLAGQRLIDMGILKFEDYFSKNPLEYKPGENISICISDGTNYTRLKTETILSNSVGSLQPIEKYKEAVVGMELVMNSGHRIIVREPVKHFEQILEGSIQFHRFNTLEAKSKVVYIKTEQVAMFSEYKESQKN